jgi:hypothetical protein
VRNDDQTAAGGRHAGHPTRSPARFRRLAGAAALACAAAGAATGAASDPACVACEAPAPPLRDAYDPAAWAALERGEVISREVAEPGAPGGGHRVAASGIVAAAPERVWAVITDWESYPRFMPNAHATRVRSREPRRARISQHLRILLSDVRYGVVWTLEPERGLARFALDPEAPHDIAAFEGSWELAALDGPRRTLVRYSNRVEPGIAVPVFLRDALTRRSLPGIVRSVRDETLRREAAAP